MKLTKEQLNKLDKDDLIDIILQLQDQDLNYNNPNFPPHYIDPNGSGILPLTNPITTCKKDNGSTPIKDIKEVK